MDEMWILNLQLFAGEKTEAPTPRRREEARRKGQVARSVDLNSAVVLLAGFIALYMAFPYIIGEMKAFTQHYLIGLTRQDMTIALAQAMFLDAVALGVRVMLPIVGVTAVAGLTVAFIQVGFVFSGEPLAVKLERIDPVEGFKRIFSKRAMVEFLKSILKMIVIGYIVYSVSLKYVLIFPQFIDMEAIQIVRTLLYIVFEMAMKVGVALLVLGLADFLYQRWEYEQSLKMTKQEVKDEYKQLEGDPQIRARQRQKQREISMRRMMAEVPKADVVITNPTHFAIALKYEAEKMSAPVVVAKGQDFMALRIKEIALANKVEVVENPELARTLYYVTDIGDVIPEDLYQAVAEVLAFVYRQKKKVL